MKRIAAICLLGLLLFNIGGYRIWFYYAEQHASAQLAEHVAQDRYNADELITLTVPLSLPYQVDWDRWEKVRGEIEIDGVLYQYVQRKVSGGNMILQCLPNKQQAKIETARDRFFQLANSFNNDQQKNTQDKTVKLTKPSLTDFDEHWSSWAIRPLPDPVVRCNRFAASSLLLPFKPVAAQPPERIA